MKDEIIIDTALAGTETAVNAASGAAIYNLEDWGQFQYGGLYGTDGPEKQQRRLPSSMSGAALSTYIDTDHSVI